MLKESELEFFDKLGGQPPPNPKRWDDVIVQTLHGPLTKQQVFNYYSMPVVREAIMAQIRKNPTIIYQHFSPHEPVLKRWEAGQPIHIKSDAANVEDPSDYQYWIERRAVEFHPVLGDQTKTVWVDLDPGKQFPFQKTKEIAMKVKNHLQRHPLVMNTSLRFSGGDGFYVIGELDKEVPTLDAKQLVHELIKPVTADKAATFSFARPDQIRLDMSTLKPTGSIRGIYSLNKNTGLVSVPVEDEHLHDFTPEDATIAHVIGRIPPHRTPIRA